MPSPDHYLYLYRYHFHTSRYLLQVAARLTPADYFEEPAPERWSIHTLLSHVVRNLTMWRHQFQYAQETAYIPPDTLPDLESVRKAFAEEERVMLEYLAQLTPADVEELVNVQGLDGKTYPFLRWRMLMHVAIHGIQHETEVAELFTRKGHSPGDLNLIDFE